ncbi:MAG TPA: hypothetical protein VG722_00110, partial [Tepidisphaeraceae bacterium]|nr:hypothetical protein [Tepidisphaeraceae bacterium]
MLPNRDRRVTKSRYASALALLSTAFVTCSLDQAYAQAAGNAAGGETGSAEQPTGIQPPAAPDSTGPAFVPPALRLTGTQFTLGGSLSETYSSNALGIANGGYDFITSIGLAAGAHDHTLRFDGDLQYNGYADIYARNRWDRISNYLNALANTTLVPEHLFFQAQAFAQPLLANQFGPTSSDPRFAASGTNTGLTNSYGYVLSPTLAFRLGDFATSQSNVTQSGVFFSQPGGAHVDVTIPGVDILPRQYLNYSATETLASGQDFGRINWALSGSGSRTKEASLTLDQATGTAQLKYAITRDFALTGTGGYESITSNQPLVRSLIGPIAMGGFEYQPSPDFQLTANAGTQFNSTSYTGSLYYRFGAFTWLTGQLSDGVETPSGRLAGNLGNA